MTRGRANRESDARWRYCRVWLPTVLVTLGLAGVVEGVLAVAGVPPAKAFDDPFVILSQADPLFEPADPGESVLQTAENKLRFFNYQSFDRKKRPNTYRIFCLGGSTTFGRPYDDRMSYAGWLRAMLPAVAPGRQWEVVNAGGISYASYRIARLMEELVAYEPDLFIIYTGHNEFLEKRVYGSINAVPRILDRVRGVLSHTRLYTVAKRMRATWDAPAPPSPESELPAEVETRLDAALGPEDFTRDIRFAEQVEAHFRHNLNRMVQLARSAGAAIVLVEPVSNLAGCSPFKSEHRASLSDDAASQWAARMADGEGAMERRDWKAAGEALNDAIRLDESYARSYFERGRIYLELGEFDAALADFKRARDLDVCPLRATGPIVAAVRSAAASLDVPLVALDPADAFAAEHGIPGSAFFLDHVHPDIDGHGVLAQALLEAIARHQDFALPADWRASGFREIARAVHARVDPEFEIASLRNLAQVFSWAGKYAEARRLARAVLKHAPEDTDAHLLIAWGAEATGDREMAESHYRTLLRIAPDHRVAPRRLAEILAEQGRLNEAVETCRSAVLVRPADPELRMMLAELLVKRGDRPAAEAEYRRVLEVVPGHAGARSALERLAQLAPN